MNLAFGEVPNRVETMADTKETKPETKEQKKFGKPVEQAKPAGKETRKIVVSSGPVEGRRIVRILSTDIDGSLPLERALRRIKGISFMFARSACISMNADGKKKVGIMSDQEIRNVEEFLKNPKLPSWMLNRRKDPEAGKDIHLTMSQLDFRRKEDINQMKRIRSYKGIRHESGQPVRGQRTRSTFRTNKSIGVSKKKASPQKAAAQKTEAKK